MTLESGILEEGDIIWAHVSVLSMSGYSKAGWHDIAACQRNNAQDTTADRKQRESRKELGSTHL